MKRISLVRKAIVMLLAFLLLLAQSSAALAEYDFQDIINDGCLTQSDPTLKANCYRDRNYAGSGQYAGNMVVNDVMNQEKAAVDKFISYYGPTTGNPNGTLLGNYRKAAWINSGNRGATNYYRTVCNIVATAAFKGIRESKPASYYDLYTDKLMSVFDDYEGAPVINGYPLAHPTTGIKGWKSWIDTSPKIESLPAIGYPCAMAASLMWDHIRGAPDYTSVWDTTYMGGNRNAATKKAKIKSVLLAAVAQVNSHYTVSYYSTQNDQTTDFAVTQGDSKAEEAAWTASFLILVAHIFPAGASPNLPAATATTYKTNGLNLLHWAYTKGTSTLPFPLTPDLQVINHNIRPNGIYGLSLLQSTARAALPYYKLGGPVNTRANIPNRLYGLDHDVYRYINTFETQLLYIASGQRDVAGTSPYNFRLIGNFGVHPNQTGYNYSNIQYNSTPYVYQNVTDWGFAAHFQNSVFAFSYAIDSNNGWHRYRENNSPYAFLIREQIRILTPQTGTNNALYMPSDYNGSQWTFNPLFSSTETIETQPLNGFNSTIVTPINQRINTHLFINSMAAFEHMLSWIFLSSGVEIDTLN